MCGGKWGGVWMFEEVNPRTNSHSLEQDCIWVAKEGRGENCAHYTLLVGEMGNDSRNLYVISFIA